MNLIEAGPEWGLYIFVGLLVVSAIQDAWQLKISNFFVGALLLAGIAFAVIAGPDWSLWQNAAMMVAMLVAGTFLFSKGWMGGGDVKLLAASLFWFDAGSGVQMLIITAIAGGVLTMGRMGLRMMFWKVAGIGALRQGSGMPYGIAIAIGGIATAWWQTLPPITP